jgi:N-methylhydantoinase A/oxoprolinase/acetone carboxylase beta subunit
VTGPRRLRIGFDIAGTFTDLVLLDPACDSPRLHKCLTTPRDLAAVRAQGGHRRRAMQLDPHRQR